MTQRHSGPERPAWPHRSATTIAALGLACLSGLIVGCSAAADTGPGSAPVASLAGGSGHVTNASTLTQQADTDMVDFARCMRAHGVPMPDPYHVPGHTGLSLALPPQDAATQAAYSACNHFITPIVQIKEAHAAAVMGPLLPALTRYAECMRSHDIAMLDPTADGQLNLGSVPGISSDFGRYSPQFHAADRACAHFLPRSVADNGTGP